MFAQYHIFIFPGKVTIGMKYPGRSKTKEKKMTEEEKLDLWFAIIWITICWVMSAVCFIILINNWWYGTVCTAIGTLWVVIYRFTIFKDWWR